MRTLLVWMGVCCLGAAVFAQTPRVAPPNPAFEAYREAVKTARAPLLGGGEPGFGLLPIPVDLSHLRELEIRTLAAPVKAFPASYDLRALGRVSPVRNQGAYGTCWAFATYGSMESGLLPAETNDFSENHLVNTDGFDLGFNDGGQAFMSMAYLARWGGPVDEADDPYANPGGSPPGLAARKHVQQVRVIPGKTSPTGHHAIKQALMEHGALLAAYYHTGASYNATHKSYYYTGSSYANHAVTLVGWDDNFDRNKFSAIPPGNGAYLAKNSWGAGWGDGGYFYVSYFDTTFAWSEQFSFSNAEPTSNFSRCYSHDPLGWVSDLGAGSSVFWAANVFTAEAGEDLDAVGFYANSVNTAYTIHIYTGVEADAPRSGFLAVTQAGISDYPGYRTISLAAPAPLKAGERFAIVLELSTPGYNYPQPVEYAYPGYSSAASAAPGQSFYSLDWGASWTDLTTWDASANFCIKGYTVNLAPTLEAITSTTPDGTYGRGEEIDVTLVFSKPVTLTGGDLAVTLETGVMDGEVTIGPFAATNRVSGVYLVQPGDTSPDLSVKRVELRGGTLRDAAGNDASLELPAGRNLHDLKEIELNEAPIAFGLSTAWVRENEPSGTEVGAFWTDDPNPGDRFVYTLVGGTGASDNDAFRIEGSNLLTAAMFDFEARNAYGIRVRVEDQGGLWDERAFAIAIVDINEPPTDVALAPAAVPENAPEGTAVGSLRAVDPDRENGFIFQLVDGEGGEDNGLFTLTGSNLATAAVFDYEERSRYGIRVRATDSGGLWVEKALDVAVVDVVELPTIRVNCGGLDGAGWAPDYGYDGGVPLGATAPLARRGSAPPFVDRTARRGRPNLSYLFEQAPDGCYTVRVHFAELRYNQAGKRLFHVNVAGKRMLSKWDIFARAGGKNRAISRTGVVNVVGGGGLRVEGRALLGNVLFNGIEVWPVKSWIEASVASIAVPRGGGAAFTVRLGVFPPGGQAVVRVRETTGADGVSIGAATELVFTKDNWSVPQEVTLVAAAGTPLGRRAEVALEALGFDTVLVSARVTTGAGEESMPLRVNCGGPALPGWSADRGFLEGRPARTWWSTIRTWGTPPEVYQTSRKGTPGLIYSFPDVPDGRYTVRLHLVEHDYNQPGKRVSHIVIEDQLAVENLDVWAMAGGAHRALRIPVAVTVSDGDGLQIRAQAVVGVPALSGIVVEIAPEAAE